MRYCFALILMVIFSFQVVPVKKIGKLLCKTQGTEEVQSNDEGMPDGSGSTDVFASDIILAHQSFDVSTRSSVLKSKMAAVLPDADSLPLVMVTKIPSPPPEC